MEKLDGPKPSYIKKDLGNMVFQQIIFAGRATGSCRISFPSKDLSHRQGQNLDGIRACQIVHIISEAPTKSPQKHSAMPGRIVRFLDSR